MMLLYMYSNITPSAWLAHENNTCQAATDALRAARSKCQVTARCCASDYWLKLSQRIQADAGRLRQHRRYVRGHQARHRPDRHQERPAEDQVRREHHHQKKQMERWVEHYLELYSTQNIVTDAALDAI